MTTAKDRPREQETSTTAVVLSIAPGQPATSVIGRILGVFVARAGLSLDRLGDALMIGDALASAAHLHSPENRVQIAFEYQPGRVDLRVGPLAGDTGERLVRSADVPGADDVIAKLADVVDVERLGDVEYVRLAICSR